MGRDTSRQAARRARRRKTNAELDSLVDDILSNSPTFVHRVKRSVRGSNREKGVVNQLRKDLRDSNTFDKIRSHRSKDGEIKHVSESTVGTLRKQATLRRGTLEGLMFR